MAISSGLTIPTGGQTSDSKDITGAKDAKVCTFQVVQHISLLLACLSRKDANRYVAAARSISLFPNLAITHMQFHTRAQHIMVTSLTKWSETNIKKHSKRQQRQTCRVRLSLLDANLQALFPEYQGPQKDKFSIGSSLQSIFFWIVSCKFYGVLE